MARLYFAQQHIFTQLGHSVLITDTPHYAYLKGDKDTYISYLKESWKYYCPEFKDEDIEKRVAKYDALIEDIRKNGIKNPITVFKRLNKNTMIYDGNHRAAIGLYLGLDIPQKEIPLEAVIAKRIAIPHVFYGSQRKNKPYQGIYTPDGKLVIEGRRNDLLARRDMIDPKDVKGKRVIDIGCNYGNSLILTDKAKALTGIDISPEILTAAVRLSVIFRKNIHFVNFDINKKPSKLKKHDTAFIFSVDAHLKTLDGLIYLIQKKVKEVVYFETHEGHEIPDKIKEQFSNITFRGILGRRRFYRCRK